MEEKEVLQKLANLTIGKKIKDVVIPIRKRTWWRRLLKMSSFKTFELYESVAGNTFRIAGVAVGLPDEIVGNSLYEIAMPLIAKHHKDIVYVVAAGITNSKEEPSKELIDLITWNLRYEDLYDTLHAVLDGAGLKAFLNSTILIKGTDQILKPRIDPIDGTELIASHSE